MDNLKLKSYIDAMHEASCILTRENHDYLVAPMVGSVPFIDVMTIIDRDFDPTKVVYMPASSKVVDVRRVMRSWYENFLEDKIKLPHKFPKVMGIDEVVAGGSVVRCLKSIDEAVHAKSRGIRQDLVERLHRCGNKTIVLEALREVDLMTDNQYSYEIAGVRQKVLNGFYSEQLDVAREDSRKFVNLITPILDKKLEYRTIGVEDSKVEDGQRNKEYRNLKSTNRIFSVSVDTILTMDKPEFSYVTFENTLKHHKGERYPAVGPSVIGFNINPKYIDFLTAIANYIGADTSRLAPVNLKRILETSNGYLPSNK